MKEMSFIRSYASSLLRSQWFRRNRVCTSSYKEDTSIGEFRQVSVVETHGYLESEWTIRFQQPPSPSGKADVVALHGFGRSDGPLKSRSSSLTEVSVRATGRQVDGQQVLRYPPMTTIRAYGYLVIFNCVRQATVEVRRRFTKGLTFHLALRMDGRRFLKFPLDLKPG